MARIFETNTIEDDESKIRIYACYSLKQLDEIIKELNDIKDKKSEDDYIVLQDKNDEDRFEIELRFCS